MYVIDVLCGLTDTLQVKHLISDLQNNSVDVANDDDGDDHDMFKTNLITGSNEINHPGY